MKKPRLIWAPRNVDNFKVGDTVIVVPKDGYSGPMESDTRFKDRCKGVVLELRVNHYSDNVHEGHRDVARIKFGDDRQRWWVDAYYLEYYNPEIHGGTKL